MLRIVVPGLFVVLLGTLLGCSTPSKPLYYPNTLAKNVTLNLKVAPSATANASTKLDTRMSVNTENPDCTSDYLGTMVLTNGENKIGLPPGKSTTLVFMISRTGTWTVAKDFLIKLPMMPMPGRQYEIDFTYVDNMIDLRLYEKNKSGRQELPRSTGSTCKSGN